MCKACYLAPPVVILAEGLPDWFLRLPIKMLIREKFGFEDNELIEYATTKLVEYVRKGRIE